MNISVEIKDETFTKLVTDAIHDIPKEELNEIAKECIKDYLKKQPDKMNQIFFDESNFRGIRPTSYLIELLKSGFHEDELIELRKSIMETAIEHRDEIIKEALTKAFVSNLLTTEFMSGFTKSLMDMQAHLNTRIDQLTPRGNGY